MNVARAAVSVGLNGLAALTPAFAGSLAYGLFCRPPRDNRRHDSTGRHPGVARNLLGTAEAFAVPHPGGEVWAYRWRCTEDRREAGCTLAYLQGIDWWLWPALPVVQNAAGI